MNFKIGDVNVSEFSYIAWDSNGWCFLYTERPIFHVDTKEWRTYSILSTYPVVQLDDRNPFGDYRKVYSLKDPVILSVLEAVCRL